MPIDTEPIPSRAAYYTVRATANFNDSYEIGMLRSVAVEEVITALFDVRAYLRRQVTEVIDRGIDQYYERHPDVLLLIRRVEWYWTDEEGKRIEERLV